MYENAQSATAYPPNFSGASLAGAATQAQPVVANTLVRALSMLEDLNKRLYQLSNQANDIASSIGGPYPVPGCEAAKDAPPSSAMQRLNDSIQVAHGTVTSLEGAMSAMRRALGA